MIIVFGSVNLDLVTEVPHIPAPGETVIGPGFRSIPGGKGANQAVAAARSGARVAFVGAVGRDDFGTLALRSLAESGVDLAGVARVDTPTGVAFISVDARGENAIVVAAGANYAVDASQLAALAAPPGSVLLLQREIRDEALFAAVHLAGQRGWRTMLNAAPSGRVPEDILRRIDTLIVNEHEALHVAREAGLAAADAHGAAQDLHRSYGLTVVVTVGADGVVAFRDGVIHRQPAPRVEAIDTTAAGDSFVGTFAAAMDESRPFTEALRRGVVAGSLACTRTGAQDSIPDRAAVDACLRRA
ncbi:ribokinase [Ancylobacter amanitiformis]|uniref:Ribokinase n=1 Tax=Ancylobacter amanitiformis TaxID=217069 RepID=A0ABU0LKB7_9HYPH|nr:ribokinase [Ancylobacter amanitiformis]MDQ0509139.1 ribokinase [Ancylobacter amanitiformis]